MTDNPQPRTFIAEPPPQIGRQVSSPTDDFRADAIAHTGEWAVLDTFDTRTGAQGKASQVRNSRGPWVGHTWDARVTADPADPARFAVYVSHLSVSTAGATVTPANHSSTARAETPEPTPVLPIAATGVALKQAAYTEATDPAAAVDMGDADPDQDQEPPVAPPWPLPQTAAVFTAPPTPDPLADPYGLPVQQ